MKSAVVASALSLVGVAAAQSSSASAAAAPSGSAAAGTTPAAGQPSSFAFSLLSTNPTAVPLASIVSNAPTQPTQPLPTTYAAGAQPTGISGAPPLPDVSKLVPSNYPALDVIVPTNSSEVQQWVNEVKNSGITIPDFAPTVAGGCAANAAAASDTNRCWWTCTGCVKESDIVDCPAPLSWGLTYDDGPSFYTENLMAFLTENNLKSTFFSVGSRVLSFPATSQYQYMQGHQIAIHTWSHPALTTLTNEQIIGELGWSKKIMKDVLGVTPTHFRPPFGDIDNRVRAIAQAMNLQPVMWTRISPQATFDTDDFDLHSGASTPSQVLQNWNYIKANASTMNKGFILLEHDLFQQSVDIATGYILPDALATQPKFNIVPVISCLNKPMQDAYVETNDNSTNPLTGGGAGALSSGAPGSAQTTGGSGSGNGSGGSGAALSVSPNFACGFVLTAVAAIFSML